MSDYTLVVRVHLDGVDDLAARQIANELLQQMHLREILPEAKLVLRRQEPGSDRNLLVESVSGGS